MKFSRSISVDLFLTKQHQNKYSKHLIKISQIEAETRQKHQKTIEQMNKIKEISRKLKKTRDQARDFKIKQHEYQQKQMEHMMVLKYRDKSEENKSNKSKNIKKVTHHTKNNKHNKSNQSLNNQHIPYNINHKQTSVREYLIQAENKKLAQNINSCKVDIHGYKKKVATEISEYLKLREHIQRFKTNNAEQHQQSRLYSHRNKKNKKSIQSKTQRSESIRQSHKNIRLSHKNIRKTTLSNSNHKEKDNYTNSITIKLKAHNKTNKNSENKYQLQSINQYYKTKLQGKAK